MTQRCSPTVPHGCHLLEITPARCLDVIRHRVDVWYRSQKLVHFSNTLVPSRAPTGVIPPQPDVPFRRWRNTTMLGISETYFANLAIQNIVPVMRAGTEKSIHFFPSHPYFDCSL